MQTPSRDLDLELPLARRDPHRFLPTAGGRHLLFASYQEALRHPAGSVIGATGHNAAGLAIETAG